MLDLYKNIKMRREELGMSQEQLAKKVGYTSRSTIARIERGDIDIARISRELGHSSINTTLGIYTHVFNGATESSRGIADTIEAKVSNSATFLPPEAKEKR